MAEFSQQFEALTGNRPFPWQGALFHDWFKQDKIPESCNLPTGLGKTNAIAIWLIALANGASVPRRLVYVVNRRTVVDQTTNEVERLRKNIVEKPELCDLRNTLSRLCSTPPDDKDSPLAISTLRGQFADNREWSADPSRPAVICGTVDMIGSRLLFSGYGLGFRSRPLHAGFLGQDALLIHDESHLEPAFQKLITAVAHEQEREQERTGYGQPMRVMELSATVRQERDAETEAQTDTPFVLRADDEAHELVAQRINATKRLNLHPCDDKPVDRMLEMALEHDSDGSAVLIFARSVIDAAGIAEKLQKATQTKKGDPSRVQSLTGTMRGEEREQLVKTNAVFRRFMPGESPEAIEPQEGTVYLVATSAGEVGVNLSADHMVCDLTTFESMAQRLGRVNRFGEPKNHVAQVDVVCPTDLPDEEAEQAERKKKPGDQKGLVLYDAARRRTLSLLQQLDGDASPAALARLDRAACAEAYSPPPRMLETSGILFDHWSMTSITPPLADTALPGCPPVAAYLHGIAEWEPPRTAVAWRQEVEVIHTPELLEKYPPAALLADYPLKPNELLQDTTERVYEALGKMRKRMGEAQDDDVPVWVVGGRGLVEVTSLSQLTGLDKKAFDRELAEATILLPARAGGLTEQGMLDGKAKYETHREPGYDVADHWLEGLGRCRSKPGVEPPVEVTRQMRRVKRVELPEDQDSEKQAGDADDELLHWDWYVRPASAEDAGSRWSRFDQLLQEHLDLAERCAREMVGRLGLGPSEAQAVIHAAAWHDLGKDRAVWQASIGNHDMDKPLAKSKRAMLPGQLSRYRHEFGSALDVLDEAGPVAEVFNAMDEPTRDLLIHLILTHHGRARPHLPPEESYDPKPGRDAAARALAAETPRRYARLQRRYGRWHLAYLESLVRAADRAASEPDTTGSDAKTAETEARA